MTRIRPEDGPDDSAVGSSDSGAVPGDRVRVRLLATSDLHMHLTGFDYCADRPDPGVGLTRIATLIGRARAEAEGATVLLFDNGDGLQGTPLEQDALQSDPDAGAHPLMAAFRHLRYDAIGLGNHDFNFGLEVLDRILTGAPCPVVVTNLRRLEPGVLKRPVAQAVLQRTVRSGGAERTLRIGVLALLPPQTVRWDARLLHGRIEVADIVNTAHEAARALKRDGCDLVVVLAHSGPGDAEHREGQETAVIPLADCDAIDAIFAGHTHQVFPGPALADLPHVDAARGTVHGTPVAMAGHAGSHLAQIDLELATDPQGRWRVAEHRGRSRPVATRDKTGTARALVDEEASLAGVLGAMHARVRARMNQPVGRCAQSLHSYFSLVAPDRAQALIARAQLRAVRPFLTASGVSDLPLLSCVAPVRFGGRSGPGNYTDIPAGTLRMRHIEDLVRFPNDVRAVLVTGRQVIDWLEMAASLFHRIEPGARGAELADPRWPGNALDALFGLTCAIDLGAPARFAPDGRQAADGGRRIVGATWQSEPIRPDQRFVVALNGYRASGGGNFAALRDAEELDLPAITIRDALRDYIASPDADAPSVAPWSFVPMPGTSVLLRTGPGGRAHLGDLAGREVEDAGIDADGFLRLLIAL